MPTSDPQVIPQVLDVIKVLYLCEPISLQPYSILDVGAGNGHYGFLFRECLDWNYGRLNPSEWEITIDAVEIDETYITPIHSYLYNNVFLSDWLKYSPTTTYDVIFMGDVLEHWPDGEWQQALKKAREYSKFTIVVCPNWQGSMEQTSWYGHEHEEHKILLSPEKVGGRCLFANFKIFMSVFDNGNTGILI